MNTIEIVEVQVESQADVSELSLDVLALIGGGEGSVIAY